MWNTKGNQAGGRRGGACIKPDATRTSASLQAASERVRHGGHRESEVSELLLAVWLGERRKMVADMCDTVLVSILKPHGSVNTVARERTAFPRNLLDSGQRQSVFMLSAAGGPGQWVPRAISPEVRRSGREGNN